MDEDDNRSVRVFVSSTFLDMQRERDVLVRQTFPALRAKFRARGVELLEVDLRWGITQEQSESGKTLPTLLAEIDRCRPYFIGLLGERYGWVPPATALTDELAAAYPSIADAIGCSVTELEIIHGVLSNPEAAKRAIFFERDPAWLDTQTPEERAVYVADSEEARAKLADLKARIRASGARVIPYAKPEDIGPAVEGLLIERIEAQFPDADAPDAFIQTARLHTAYARERCGLHIGAAPYMAALDAWIAQVDAKPMLITGASGGGKSTLVANWLAHHRAAAPKDIVFEHYLGASSDSADPIRLIGRLWEHLNRATGEAVEQPSEERALIDGLPQRLAQAHAFAERSGGNVLIVLDGLDQMSSQQDLRWLPTFLPQRVRLLSSSLDGNALRAAETRGWAKLDVVPLTDAHRRELIDGTLSHWGRSLSSTRTERILASSLAGSPLFIKTLLHELRIAGVESELNARLDSYLEAHDIPDLFARVLRRLEGDCGADFARAATSLVWAGRAGLEETEIIATAGATPLAWAMLRNGLSDGLRDKAGRIVFSHDFLRQAVETRYLATDDKKRTTHLAIADRFEGRVADQRQAEELPFQLRAAEAWDRLEALLTDVDRFALLRARGDNELLSYWLPLKQYGCDLEVLLCAAFERRVGEPARWSEQDAYQAIGLTRFLHFAGAFGARRTRLQEQVLAAGGRIFGAQDARTAVTLSELGSLFFDTNRQVDAEPLFRRALAINEARFGSEHSSVATSLNNLAAVLQKTNRHVEAEMLFRRALVIEEAQFGLDHPRVAVTLNNLAVAARDANHLGEAEALYRRAISIFEASFGADHLDVSKSLINLADLLRDDGRQVEAEAILRRAAQIMQATLGPNHADVATCLNNLAKVLPETRQVEAEALCRLALAIREESLGPNHPAVADSLGALANLLVATQRGTEAEPLLRRAVAIVEASYGDSHPSVATALCSLANLLRETGRHADAEPLYRRALRIDEASFGPSHHEVAADLDHLALLLRETNRHSESESLQRRALAIEEAAFGPEHPNVALRLHVLANSLEYAKQNAEAEALYRRALAITVANFGSTHANAAFGLNRLGRLLATANRRSEAELLFRRAIDLDWMNNRPNDPELAASLNNLANLLRETGRCGEAEPLYRRALTIDEANCGPDHPNVATDLNHLALVLQDAKRLAEAEPLYRRALAVWELRLGPDHPHMAVGLNNLAALLEDADRHVDAEPLYRRAIAIDEAGLGPEHPNIALHLSNLAGLLRAVNRHAEAEPCLRRALAILEKTLGADHPSTRTVASNHSALLNELDGPR